MRRYQACEIYADKSHGKQMNLGWFAAMETLMATAQVMDREGILVDDWEFPSPLSIDSIKEAWLEITPKDVDRLLNGEEVKKVHCLTCGC